MKMREVHTPVLLEEVLKIFNPQPGENYIDATVNGGGHAKAILERIGEKGRILGIDLDCELIDRLKFQVSPTESRVLDKVGTSFKFQGNIQLVCGNYANIKSIAEKHGFTEVNGILFDLGFSSYHLEKSGRGFSFLADEPLDMRYSPEKNELTAEKIINTWDQAAIEDILRRCGEERYSRRIAGAIVRQRSAGKITRSRELADIVARAIKGRAGARIHPATRTFQALRIAVNDELENLERALEDSPSLLAPGGKIAIISFHSLEDRMTKQFLKEKEKSGEMRVLTARPLAPSSEEINRNPRARSAKLRAAERI